MTITVKDAAGATQTVKTINDLAADGGQVTIGNTTDLIVAAGAAGTLSAKLRRLTNDIGQLLTNLGGALSLNAGNADANTQRVVLVTDQTKIPVEGSVASGALDSGNPVKVGGNALSPISGSALTTTAYRSNIYSDLDGVLYSRDYCVADLVNATVTCTAGAETTVVAAPASNISLMVEQIIIDSTASLVSGSVSLKAGTGGTELQSLPFPAGTGATFNFAKPIVVGSAVLLSADPTGSANIKIGAIGHKLRIS